MSNWFQDNPTTSVITYTIFVAGATWAASTFILQDNKLNLANSELESQKAIVEQYKAKSEILQSEIEGLRIENQEYRAWLAQSKDAIPIMVPQLIKLKSQLAKFKQLDGIAENATGTEISEIHNSSTATVSPKAQVVKNLPVNFSLAQTAKRGIAGIDETTGLVVTVVGTRANNTASLIISFPDRDVVTDESVYAGKKFKFNWGGQTIVLTIIQIEFYTDTVSFKLTRL